MNASLLTGSIQRLSQVVGGEQVVELPLDLIDPDPTQPRKTFDDDGMKDIAASIRATRVHEPIIVAPRGGRYLIVFGERRWRGSHMAEKKTIPSIVRTMSDVDIQVARLVENMQREDVKPLEEAAAIKDLITLLGGGRGVQKRAAELLGCSEALISQRLALLELPAEIKGAVDAGHITDATAALDVARVHAADPGAAGELVEKAKAGTLKRNDVREAVKAVKKPSKEKLPAPAEGTMPPRCDKTVDMLQGGESTNDNSQGSPQPLSVCQNPLSKKQQAALTMLLDDLADAQDPETAFVYVIRKTIQRGRGFGFGTKQILVAINEPLQDNSAQSENGG